MLHYRVLLLKEERPPRKIRQPFLSPWFLWWAHRQSYYVSHFDAWPLGLTRHRFWCLAHWIDTSQIFFLECCSVSEPIGTQFQETETRFPFTRSFSIPLLLLSFSALMSHFLLHQDAKSQVCTCPPESFQPGLVMATVCPGNLAIWWKSDIFRVLSSRRPRLNFHLSSSRGNLGLQKIWFLWFHFVVSKVGKNSF